MDVLILAAGRGTRMGEIEKPKCLLEFDGTSIIKYQIKCFKNLGINRIFVVTGFHSDLLHSHLHDEVIFLHNDDFATTNNISSLWTARNSLDDDFICIYGDLLFHKKILENLLNDENDICMVIEKNIRSETMKVKLDSDLVIEVNKKISEKNSNGNFIGMTKFSKNIIPSLFKEISELIKNKNINFYYTSAIESMINNGQKVHYVATNNLQWMDIDEPNEFDDAKKIFKQMETEI